MLFSNLPLIATALATVGIFMIIAGSREGKVLTTSSLSLKQALGIGLIQGFCLPFRGFSRSGSTISAGLLFGLPKKKIEEFSFALAVVLTPAVIAKEIHRLIHAHVLSSNGPLHHLFFQTLVGMVFSFFAGLLALRWLSRWLEGGRWKYFGIYCLVASSLIFFLNYFLL